MSEKIITLENLSRFLEKLQEQGISGAQIHIGPDEPTGSEIVWIDTDDSDLDTYSQSEIDAMFAEVWAAIEGGSVAVTGVSLNKSTSSISVNGTDTLVATIAPSNATNKTVIWSKTGNDISISGDGLNCIVTGVNAGSGTVTVTTQDGSYTASCAITVTSGTIAVTGVSLDKNSAEILEGETTTLTATITPSNATDKTVTWTTSSQNVTLVPNGLTCEVIGATEGNATVTVTTTDGSYTATCAITVTASEIPQGYTLLKCLQGNSGLSSESSHGRTYIDLGFKPTNGIKCEAKITGYTQPSPIGAATALGVMSSSSNRFDLISFGTNNNTRVFGLGYVSYNFTNTPVVEGTEYDVEAYLDSGNQYLKVNGNTVFTGTASGSITADYNMYLFNRIKNGSLDTGWFNGKIYYVKIWQSGTLIRDLVPCLDDQNVPCMYDKVNDHTYYNAGNGTFLYETL